MEKRQKSAPKDGQERIITLGDLMKEILRRLPLVILVMVIFAVLLGGYQYIQDKKAAELAAAPVEEAVENTLTEDEQEEVNNVLKVIANLKEQQEYVENSVLLKINAYDESQVTLQYYINADIDAEVESGSIEDYRQDLLDSYQAYISNGALSAAVKEAGVELELQYIAELISFEATDEDSESLTTNVSSTFYVTVIHVDQESCEELAAVVEECLSNYAQVLNSSVGSHSLELMEYTYTEVVDKSLWTYKYDRVNSIVTMQTKVETLEAELTSEQIQILELQTEADSTEEVEEESSETIVSVSISKKYLLLGAAIGLILACLYIVLSYIMRGTINEPKDLQYLYGVRVLGELHAGGKRNPFVRLGNLLIGKKEVYLTPEEEQALLFSNIRLFCEKNQADHVLLLFGSAKLPKDWAAALSEQLAAAGIAAETAENPVYSAQALERLAEYDTVVLIEQVRGSRYEVLEKEIGLCEASGIEIAGAAVFI